MATRETEAERLQHKLDEAKRVRDEWRMLALSCFPEWSLEQRGDLIAMIDTEDGLTCDWGPCFERAVDCRYHPKHGWLPVCVNHLAKNVIEED